MLRRILSIVVLLAAILGSVALWRNSAVSVTDFTAFWIAGRQLVQHENPYDVHQALVVEQSMGFRESRPLVMRNPPWALWSTLGIGALGYGDARLLWTVCLIVMLWFSADRLWRAYGGGRRRWVSSLVTFTFAPTLACLSVGQTAPFVLLGLTLFLCLQPQKDFWAGVALSLAAFKPQVAVLFWLALLLWSVHRRKWKPIAGLIIGTVLLSTIALAFDSHAFNHYQAMMLAEAIEVEFIPTIGGLLRLRFGLVWLQILPLFLGVAWCLYYYFSSRQSWCWRKTLPILLFASLLVTPYAWLEDETILLAGLIAAAASVGALAQLWAIALLFLAANGVVVSMLASGIRVNSPYYLWTIWVWMTLYIATNTVSRRERKLEVASSR